MSTHQIAHQVASTIDGRNAVFIAAPTTERDETVLTSQLISTVSRSAVAPRGTS